MKRENENEGIKILFKSYYFIYFIYVAATTYINIHFESIGISASQIGLMTAVAKALAITALPVWGMMSDYFEANKKILIFTILGTLTFSLSFLLTKSFFIIFILYSFFMIFSSSVVPLSDSLLLNHLDEKAEQYGQFRVWGSIGYMAGIIPFGWIIEQTQSEATFILAASGLFLSLFFAYKLPKSKRTIKVASLGSFKLLFKNKDLLYFLVFTFLIQAPLTANFVYFPIYFKSIGGGESLLGIGMFIAAGSELIIFQKADIFLKKFKLKKVLLLSAVAFGIRWFLISIWTSPVLLLLTQLFHGLTYALFHVTAVSYISKLVGEKFRSTGQNLYASIISISTVASSLLGGMIYDGTGGAAMYALGSAISLIAGFSYFYLLHKIEYGQKN
ncbi:MFS transporter [Halanaerobium saccharolyticum]